MITRYLEFLSGASNVMFSCSQFLSARTMRNIFALSKKKGGVSKVMLFFSQFLSARTTENIFSEGGTFNFCTKIKGSSLYQLVLSRCGRTDDSKRTSSITFDTPPKKEVRGADGQKLDNELYFDFS